MPAQMTDAAEKVKKTTDDWLVDAVEQVFKLEQVITDNRIKIAHLECKIKILKAENASLREKLDSKP